MKTILVTGGAGFIGKHFVKLLKEKDLYDQIIVYDQLTYASDLDYIKSLMSHKIKFIHGDINDYSKLEKVFKNNFIDKVVNFAAESHVDRSIQSSRSFFMTNVLGLQTLLDVCRANLNKEGLFIQISTDEVYGGSLSLDSPLNHEGSPLNPKNPYAASKASGDLLVKSYEHTYNFSSMIIRLTNNYGLHQNKEKLIPKVMDHILNHQAIPLYGDGNYYRNWLYVEDACRGIYDLIEKGHKQEIYNLVGSGLVSNVALVHDMIQSFKSHGHLYKGQIDFVEDRLGHDLVYLVDGQKVQRLIARELKPLKEGLSLLIEDALNK